MNQPDLFASAVCPVPRCWGNLLPIDTDNLACDACGNIVPLVDPADATEADGVDLFDIPQGQLTAAETDPLPWHRDRGEFDPYDTLEDIQPYTRTTHY